MKVEDLQLIFRASGSASLESQSYILNLLNKFEVAVTWDSRTLLIPSLLPTEEQTCKGLPGGDARVKVTIILFYSMCNELIAVVMRSLDTSEITRKDHATEKRPTNESSRVNAIKACNIVDQDKCQHCFF